MSDEEKSRRAHALRRHLMKVHGYTPLRVSDMLDKQAEATHWDDHNTVFVGGGALAGTMEHTEPAELHLHLQKSEVVTGLQQHLRDVHKNEAAGNLTMTQALAYHAQEHLSAGGVRNHSEPRQLHRALAYRLAEIQGLEVPKEDIANFLDQVLEGKIRGDYENERESIEAALNGYPAGWTERRRPSFGDPEKPRATMALPTLDAQPDDGVERRRALRPGSQPLPVPQKGVAGAHDMVMADLRGIMTRRQAALRAAGRTREAEAVRLLLKEIETDLMERRALGLRRYGSLLQAGNGRDPLRDAYEEVIDLVCYFRQLMMARDEATTLLVELLQDRAVGEDPVVREKIGRVMYLLAGQIIDEEGSNDASG